MPGVRLRGVGFWLIAGVLGLLVFASSAPSPLYGVYQQKWQFSATTLTAIFGVYALALIVTLLVVGALSDYVGRRPVIVGALVVEIGAMSLFLAATGVGWLYAARVLQGCAVGAATSALSAALIDLQPQGSTRAPVVNSFTPGFGLALGALVTSALVQYAPAPTHLIWWLLLGGFALAIPAVLAVPESVARHPGALRSLRPRLGVPRPCLGAFVAGLPGMVALWALGGFYLSLGPSLAGSITGSRNLLWGGVMIVLLTGVGSLSSLLFRNSAPAAAVLWGAVALLAGVGVTVGGIEAPSAALLLVGTAVAGVGFGVAFLGSFRILSALAAPDGAGSPGGHHLRRVLPVVQLAGDRRRGGRDPLESARRLARVRRLRRWPERHRRRQCPCPPLEPQAHRRTGRHARAAADSLRRSDDRDSGDRSRSRGGVELVELTPFTDHASMP